MCGSAASSAVSARAGGGTRGVVDRRRLSAVTSEDEVRGAGAEGARAASSSARDDSELGSSKPPELRCLATPPP